MQATIYNIKPFDAEIGTTIKFNWSGNQVFGNRCIIIDNDTNTEIYNHYIDSFKLEHTLDLTKIIKGQSLTNGKQYIAFITVFDQNGVESEVQTMGQLFLCLKTPEFRFTNVSENQTLSSSSYDFQIVYSQENGELLDSWQITIYDMTNNELSSSGVKYTIDNTSHTFSGFTSKSQYKVRAEGQTINGMSLDTGYITFSVSYDMAAVFSLLELTNLPKSGAILFHSNIISADGKPEIEPVAYINGTYADLRNNKVTYNEGFLFDGNFSLVMYAYHVMPNITFLEFSSADGSCNGTLTYRVGNLGTAERVGQVELRISNGAISYMVNSNIIAEISETTMLGVCLTRENGFYDIQITNLGEVE